MSLAIHHGHSQGHIELLGARGSGLLTSLLLEGSSPFYQHIAALSLLMGGSISPVGGFSSHQYLGSGLSFKSSHKDKKVPFIISPQTWRHSQSSTARIT